MNKNKLVVAAGLVALLGGSTLATNAQDYDRERLPGLRQGRPIPRNFIETHKFEGQNIAVWRPAKSGRAPLVIFSHSFHGANYENKGLMEALAKAGYLVIAPNHTDALGKPSAVVIPEGAWTESTFKDRRNDIANLYEALRNDPAWASQIDWTKVSLLGHSLGGYTVLGVAGAWPSWRLSHSIRAVVALSPYTGPFMWKGNIAKIEVPVMYQGAGGNRNTPALSRAFDRSPSPAELVDYRGSNPFSNRRNWGEDDLVNHYTVAFLDKYVKGDLSAQPGEKRPGVSIVLTK